MKPVKVTVLMYVFNEWFHLHKAIKSILQQTFSDFEFMIIDDCSENNCTIVINSFDDRRIKFIRNKNYERKVRTLNKAIALAAGEFIARMEPRDIAHPWRLEKQVFFMQKNTDCGMLGSWIRAIDINGNFLNTTISYGKFLYYLIHFEPYPYFSAFIFRKNIAVELGCYTNETLDFNLCKKISKQYKIWNIDEPLTDIRINASIHFSNPDSIIFFNEMRKEFEVVNGSKVQDDFVACYMNNFEPVLREKKLKKIIECIDCFDKVSGNILSMVNCNRQENEIHYCWYEKRKHMLRQISLQLPLSKSISLLLHYREIKMLLKNSFLLLKNNFKKILSHKK